jgi:sec-independent protein translocase protein TatA
MSRSLGRSLRIFKTEIKGMSEDDKARERAKAEPVAPRALEAAETSTASTMPTAPAAQAEASSVEPSRSRPRPSPGPGMARTAREVDTMHNPTAVNGRTPGSTAGQE